ncbi:hypothetical protein N431DRAFT_471621 [Stipitochalara longipes BDJ]|nr:hypothetical protein N431DRAFT_471621 [Stipitochalara longipes BDJ]
MDESITAREHLRMVQPEELSIDPNHGSTSSAISDLTHEKIAPISDNDDLYSADEIITEKKIPIVEDIPSEKKKKKAEFDDADPEDAAPPPYAPALAEEIRRPLWKRRWFLLAVIGGLIVLIIVLAVSLGVELSKNAAKNHSGSGSSGTGGSSSPTSNPSSPTSVAHSGNASPPIRNTALAAITLPGSTSSDAPQPDSLVQIFFQDKDYYLCSKNSIAGVESWSLSDNGTRILPALNSTPISVVHGVQGSNGYLPIRVFFIDARGFLADIYQTTWGG